MTLPYATSAAGSAREGEIRQILRGCGASAVGFMVDDEAEQIIAQFQIGGRRVTIPVSVRAYRERWLAENPQSNRSRKTHAEYHEDAQRRAEAAAWAILRDWMKATAAMIAAGIVDADTAFLAHVHVPTGQRMIEAVRGSKGGAALLPPPDKP
jgi:hypothetical protein